MILRRALPALAIGLLLAGCSGAGAVPENPTTPPVVPPVESTTAGPERPSAEPADESTPPTDDAPEPVTDPTPEPPAGVPTPTENPEPPVSPEPLPGEPTVVAGKWSAVEIEVSTAADAAALSGLPAGFQEFAAQLVETVDEGGCQSDIVVTAHHPAGFVTGQEFAPGCGGSHAVWGSSGGSWGRLVSMQALLPCSEFANNSVPPGHPELECLDDAGNQTDW